MCHRGVKPTPGYFDHGDVEIVVEVPKLERLDVDHVTDVLHSIQCVLKT